MRSLWAHLLSWFLTGQFQGLTWNAAWDCALFASAAMETRANEKENVHGNG